MKVHNNELYHHGRKGQKWGVRNGPPYPIDDKILKKGAKLNTISLYTDAEYARNRNNWMYTFNPEDKWDSSVYRGAFAKYKMSQGYAYVCEHQYEVVKDLKMPTKQERIDEFIDMYTNNKKMVVSDLKIVKSALIRGNVAGDFDVNLKKLETKEDYKKAYAIFNHAMEASYAFRSTRRYSEIMAQKYDAMVDDNNQGYYNDAHDPIIIFRANEALKVIGKTNIVDYNKMNENYSIVREELKKKGKMVKL